MTGLDGVKAATWGLHTKAERSGIIADILAGSASRIGVALLLRNLLPVYQVLDRSSCGHPDLARSAAIEADLLLLSPEREPPLLAEGHAYALDVLRSAEGNAESLIAHAYVRYLGDLNGGLIIRRRLAACLGDIAQRMAFCDYPALADPRSFAQTYREELDRAVRSVQFNAVAAAAMTVFGLNIALSEAVRTAEM